MASAAASYVCRACAESPGSHSFVGVGESDGATLFYTCPAKATQYKDTSGILAHYDGMLSDLRGRPWRWLFDAEGFEMKHAMELGTAVGLAKMIRDKYGASLQEVVILNPTWHVRAVLRVVLPFLGEAARCIRIQPTELYKGSGP